MPRKLNPNELIRNNVASPKVTMKRFNPRNAAVDSPETEMDTAKRFLDRLGIIYAVIFACIFLLMFFLHFETNRHLKEMTSNIDNSKKDLLNLTRHLNLMTDDIQVSSPVRPPMNRIDHAQFLLGAKVIKLQAVELPMNGPSNEIFRHILGMSVPNTACNILGRGVDRKNFLVIKGDKAIITIRLNQPVFADTIRVDHFNEDVRDFKLLQAMPKDIAVYGIHMKTGVPVLLGKMQLAFSNYSKQSSGAIHIKPTESFELFKIEILSNHGNPDFTRLYKVRIYGEVDEEDET